MQQITNENSIGQLPSSSFDFVKKIAKGYSKSFFKNFLKSILISSAVFVSNLIITSLIGNGALKESSVLSLLAVRPGNMLKGSLIWVTMAALMLSFIEKVKLQGVVIVLKRMGSAVGSLLNLKKNFRDVLFLLGSSIALLFSMVIGSSLISFMLFMSSLLACAFSKKSSLVYIFSFIIKRMKDLFFKKARGFSGMEKGLHIISGFTFGFGIHSFTAPFGQRLLIQISVLLVVILMLVLALRKHTRSQKSSAKA